MKKREMKGITLIALVVTIIVLLILAGIGISLIVGNNGLFTRAENATKETSKSQIKEEIEFKITEAQMDKVGGILTREDIIDAVGRIEGIVVEVNGEEIEGEYKDYFFEIDENNQVIVGDKLTGEKPTGIAEVITEGEDLEEVQIKVTAHINEGTIVSINSLNEAELVESEENTDTVKIFKVKQNGEYTFKIRAGNGRSARVSCSVNNLISFSVEEDILTAIEKMSSNGRKKIQVTGKKENGTETTEIYSMNVIYHKGDMILDGVTEYEGSTLTSNIYEFGNVQKDVATGISESQMAQNTVVLKVDGNLTINENVTLTSVKNAQNYGGPKGMVVYCTGILTNNGKISMTARGGYAKGQDVYLLKNGDGTFEYVQSEGGLGAANRTSKGANNASNATVNSCAGRRKWSLCRLRGWTSRSWRKWKFIFRRRWTEGLIMVDIVQ